MEEEERNMQRFFEEEKKGVSKDPTLRSKQNIIQRSQSTIIKSTHSNKQ